MRKYLILITMIIGSIVSFYAQDSINMVNILNIKQEIESLEHRITGLIKKNPALSKIQGLRQYHILFLYSPSQRKEDFYDYSFLYHLETDYYFIRSNLLFRKKKKFIKASTFITDSIGNLIATGDARHIVTFNKRSYLALPNVKMAKMFFDKDIDFAFYLASPYSMDYVIGLKKNNLYALEKTKAGLKLYNWAEFMDCCFDDWFHAI